MEYQGPPSARTRPGMVSINIDIILHNLIPIHTRIYKAGIYGTIYNINYKDNSGGDNINIR